jgi:hypothetical protein
VKDLAAITTTTLVLVLMLLAAVVVFNLLRGKINTVGLVRTSTDGSVDPERVLLMIATVMFAFGYLSFGLSSGAPDGSLPDLPDEIITALGGSNLLYLSGKIFKRSKIVS